jgi:dTMP kinase
MDSNGILIAFEGIDGSGKSTAAKHIDRYLLSRGRNSCLLEIRSLPEESVPWQIKRITQDAKNSQMAATTETFLYLASLAERVSQYVIPSLADGKVVLADRFSMSIAVLAIHARRQDSKTVRKMIDFATKGIIPHFTILFDVETATALQRKRSPDKPLSRKESEGSELFNALRQGYLKETELLGEASMILRSDHFALADMLKAVEEAVQARI